MFCKKLLAFIRPLRNDTYGIYDPLRVRLVDRVRLGFSHLRKAKFRHNFADTFESIMFMLSWNWKYRTFLSAVTKWPIISHNPYEWFK